ncbi:MAG: Crp/Fnr family transcriptional regulator [Spirochaetaceae bacterium]|nr:Crp/Fnr family transcriptional regulator [Spirochaetaceae bacterium]
MKEYIETIKKAPIFKNFSEENIIKFLGCSKAKVKIYKKNEIIFLAGNLSENIGLIIEGVAHVIREDFWGNKTIVGELHENEIFGEVFAIQNIPLENTAIAKTTVKILLINTDLILNPCQEGYVFHDTILINLIMILAKKTMAMNRKLEHITKRNMKDKILSYLSRVSEKEKKKTFVIPYNRTELSEFLCVDRAALSKELSKLQKEGLINYKKNEFTLN